jgi:hypothetical protein
MPAKRCHYTARGLVQGTFRARNTKRKAMQRPGKKTSALQNPAVLPGQAWIATQQSSECTNAARLQAQNTEL